MTSFRALYLCVPPIWWMVSQMEGSLRVGIQTSTLIYRVGGVWFNQSDQGIDSPRIADIDIDPETGLRLFFNKPMIVPDTLHDELLAITPADPSWTPVQLIQQSV